MLKTAHCLDNRLTDGGKFVSPTQRPRSTLQKHFSASGIQFRERLSKFQGPVRPEGLDKFKKFIQLTEFRTRVLPAYSIIPQQLRYRVP
jgi:hypothetical protein